MYLEGSAGFMAGTRVSGALSSSGDCKVWQRGRAGKGLFQHVERDRVVGPGVEMAGRACILLV